MQTRRRGALRAARAAEGAAAGASGRNRVEAEGAGDPDVHGHAARRDPVEHRPEHDEDRRSDVHALSNATATNWKKINSDLKKNRIGVPDFWSAYRRESLHEDYHWKVEWQGKVKKHLAKAENRIAKLKVDFTTAPTEADADAALKPQAAAIFKDEMDKARAAYNKLGDAPGDPPYRAQAPALDALRGRVTAHAKASKWK